MNLSLNRIKSQNQMTNIYIGSALLILSILDVFLNSFFSELKNTGMVSYITNH